MNIQSVDPADETSLSLISVVGVGASAGGLEAFRQLLAALPVDLGVAVVLIQHLDPRHESSLTEILRRTTKMPVKEAVDSMPVQGNQVYVIPPNTELTIANRLLKLKPRGQTPGPHMPIDQFLRSLAADCRNNAIGVILSGNGSDGSLGLQAIREAGGVTFAQDPATAEFPSMPRSAEGASCVDFVLPPTAIAAELARITRDPHFEIVKPAAADSPKTEGDAGLGDILALIHQSTGIDFSLYREKTVHRRIIRRLALRNVKSIEEYEALLRKDPAEAGLLQRDLLISVTSFFRDPASFDALTKLAFPSLVRDRSPDSAIRIWVAGCATGEEAYSIGIALLEFFRETGVAFPVQIFASDVSESAVATGRNGRYLENIAADISVERLNRYFVRVEGGYLVGKAVREMCVFSRHNLIDDPPFAKLDLITCRNVLIYLGSVQKNVIALFHYALKQDGFLMLGQSETADSDGMFSIIDRDYRIYRRAPLEGKSRRFRARGNVLPRSTEVASVAVETTVTERRDADMRTAVDHILLSKYNSVAILVDEGLEVLEIRGDVTPFCRLPAGKMSFHLLKLIPDTGLFLEIEKLVRGARENGEAVRRTHVPYEYNGGIREVNLEVTQLYDTPKRALLILIEPALKVEDQTVDSLDKSADSRDKSAEREEAITSRDRQIAKLKQEVTEARLRLESALEDHQASDEENQSAVEETQSTNEELQSLNEELETAKEELQSTNEELLTVNQELEFKNTALTAARDFADSVVETVQVPLLTLDKEMRIKSVNEAFSKVFLMPRRDAVGQLLYSLGGGSWDFPGLRDRLSRVLTDNQSFDDFAVRGILPSIGARELVINAHRVDPLELVLVAVDDVTTRIDGERALHATEESLRQAQKMEAIGRLAGGIAHDFSNVLTAIMGYSRLAADTLDSNHEAIEYVQEIEKAGQRAAALTDQLLAFSRRKVLQPKIFDVNAVVADFQKMFRHILGEQIKVVFRPSADLWHVRADPGEIGRALMNLCLNARDAMPAGGTLTVQTANVTISEAEEPIHKLGAGQYVELDVRDTGIGMDQETQTHAFEPFFTTKEVSKGTGLGLATVFGIVEQSGGAIWFNSELGRGTSFSILLPAVSAVPTSEDLSSVGLAEESSGVAKTILLVEDQEQVRSLASRILQRKGYVILEASDAGEAISVCERHPGGIDLLLSDVVMPEIGGRILAERILRMRPEIKVLFMSGHTDDVILKEGIKSGTPFLRKPFLPIELANKVREVLNSQRSSTQAQNAAG